MFCRKKRCIIKASGTGRENRGMLPGKACPHPSKKQRKSTVMEILHEINPALEALAYLGSRANGHTLDRLEERLQARGVRKAEQIGRAHV